MTHPILNWKRCKECGYPFDIAIDFDKCPQCRNKNKGQRRLVV